MLELLEKIEELVIAIFRLSGILLGSFGKPSVDTFIY